MKAMKITLTEEEIKAVQGLSDQKALNMEAADLYNSYLTEAFSDIGSDRVRKIQGEERCSEEEAFYGAMLEALDLDPEDPELAKLAESNAFDQVTRLDPRPYFEDPYYRDISVPERRLGEWEFRNSRYRPFEGFIYQDTEADPRKNYREITHLGYFAQDVPYLTVLQNQVVWMSITPHEINTMKKPLAKAHGKTVTYGLGLGYFAYLASLREEVTSVTVVEKDSQVIRLFETNILPQMKTKAKIRIVQDDAFRYAQKQAPSEHFDTSFFDIYHSPEEALPLYLRFKALEDLSPETAYDYWIEESILCLARRYVLILIEEALDGFTAKDYIEEESPEDILFNRLYRTLENREITSLDDVKELLSDESLKDIAKKIITR
jgi:hypothetical protein